MVRTRRLFTELRRRLYTPSHAQKSAAGKFFNVACDPLGKARRAEDLPRIVPPALQALPQVSFIGRSNVGKSSLINSMIGAHKSGRAASISSKPGHTRSVNLYNLRRKLVFVDLPGYGYGGRSYFAGLVDGYLKNRSSLSRCCLLVDSRTGPKDMDWDMAQALEDYGLPYQVVLTKVDKLKPSQLEVLIASLSESIARHCQLSFPEIFPVSTVRPERGIVELRCFILNAAGIDRTETQQ